MKFNKLTLFVLPLLLTSCGGGSSAPSGEPSSTPVDPYKINEEYYNKGLREYGLVDLDAKFILTSTITNDRTGDKYNSKLEGDEGKYHSYVTFQETIRNETYTEIKKEDYVPEKEGYFYRFIEKVGNQYIENDFGFDNSPYVSLDNMLSDCGFVFKNLEFSSLTYIEETHTYHVDEHVDPILGLLTNININFENGALKSFSVTAELTTMAADYSSDPSISVIIPTPDRVALSGNAMFSRLNSEVSYKEAFLEAMEESYCTFYQNGSFEFYTEKGIDNVSLEVINETIHITGTYEFQLDDFVITYTQLQINGENQYPLGHSEVHRGKITRTGEITFTAKFFGLQDDLSVSFILTSRD